MPVHRSAELLTMPTKQKQKVQRAVRPLSPSKHSPSPGKRTSRSSNPLDSVTEEGTAADAQDSERPTKAVSTSTTSTVTSDKRVQDILESADRALLDHERLQAMLLKKKHPLPEILMQPISSETSMESLAISLQATERDPGIEPPSVAALPHAAISPTDTLVLQPVKRRANRSAAPPAATPSPPLTTTSSEAELHATFDAPVLATKVQC